MCFGEQPLLIRPERIADRKGHCAALAVLDLMAYSFAARSGGAGLIMGLFPVVSVWVSGLLPVQFPTVVVFASLAVLLAIMLSFSVLISRWSERDRELAREPAFPANRVQCLEDKNGTPGS